MDMKFNLPTATADAPVVLRLPRNELGRDFVVGDVHGMFPHLEAILDDVEFDTSRDRLLSVGDLVDRGPASKDALRWLAYPWFHACRGNHEQFAIDSVSPEDMDFWVKYNGGEWWLELSMDEQHEYRQAFLRMPLAMQVHTLSGVVGIVHADVPPALTWERFLELLEAGHQEVTLYALFSRNRVHGLRPNSAVAGAVDRIYCGHTPVRDSVHVDNVHYIDTGAVYATEGYEGARLTMVKIHPERHKEYYVRSDRVVRR